jgi:very-short-patch-repair endonuclease
MPRHKIASATRAFANRLRIRSTALEEALWRELRAKRLHGAKFRRQVPLEGYVADFVCFEARLVVEVDGPMHARPHRRLQDAERDRVLRAQGFRVLRFDGDIVLSDLPRVITAIREALAMSPSPDRLRRPPSPARGEGESALMPQHNVPQPTRAFAKRLDSPPKRGLRVLSPPVALFGSRASGPIIKKQFKCEAARDSRPSKQPKITQYRIH